MTTFPTLGDIAETVDHIEDMLEKLSPESKVLEFEIEVWESKEFKLISVLKYDGQCIIEGFWFESCDDAEQAAHAIAASLGMKAVIK